MDIPAPKPRANPATDVIPQALQNKVAVVTGSSAGIGAAIARELSERGAIIVLNFPDASCEADASAIGSSLKTKYIAVQADLATPDGPAYLIKKAVDAYGRIDILVNNAGISIMGHVETISLELWDRQMATNVRGAFLATQAALPYLPPQSSGGGGRIIFVTSQVAKSPPPHQVSYATSKGATASLARALAVDLPPDYGCTVNAVSPGVIDTKSFRRELGKEDNAFLTQIFDEATPVKGWLGLPEDVAHVVGFLSEERSSWINGASINVSGGMFMD